MLATVFRSAFALDTKVTDLCATYIVHEPLPRIRMQIEKKVKLSPNTFLLPDTLT